MKLIYLPDDLVIVQDDPDHPIVASLSMAVMPPGTDVHRLGRLLSAAPQLLALLSDFLKGERDDYGGLYLNGYEADAVREAVLNLSVQPILLLSQTPTEA